MNSVPVTQRRTSTQTREHVLQVAHELFYWHGIHTIGVDRIAREANIAPTTLYRLFASKDDLIASYVEHARYAYQEWFIKATQTSSSDPREQILAIFDELIKQIRPDKCRGCPFLMVLAEFPDDKAASHQHAVALKRWVHARFVELAIEMAQIYSVDDPVVLADRLTLILEGSYASVQAMSLDGPAWQARTFVDAILPR